MDSNFNHVYHDTVDFLNCIITDYDFYGELIEMLKVGQSEISIHKKQLLKQIDESWILAIEKALPSLDVSIRNPSKFLEEIEEVMPIELSRNISAKSIRHLAQHTDFINSIDGDVITPSKILNVYRDETIETYENKFIYTLIDRLFSFVQRRYSKLAEYGKDESSTKMDFSSKFDSDKTTATVKFSIELQDKITTSNATNDYTKSDNWERVEKIRNILLDYLNTDFVKTLKGKFIRPPVMRTNAITKNKDLKICLELWQFIESYDKIGYEIAVNETAENPDKGYIYELYSLLALQYVSYKYHVDGELAQESAIVAEKSDAIIMPRIITDFKPTEVEEFNVYDVQQQKYVKISQSSGRKRLSESEIKIRQAIDDALKADKKLVEFEKERIKIQEQKRKEELLRKEQERLRLQKEQEQKRIQQEKLRLQKESEQAEQERLSRLRKKRENRRKKRMKTKMKSPIKIIRMPKK